MIVRNAFVAAAAAGALCVAVSAASAQSTTRIEPRPFYGAVVTLEEGVRVIRPLPPTRHVIINPNNTPLSLSINDTRVYEQRSVRHYHSGEARGDGTPRYFGGGYYFGGPGIRNHGGKFGRHGGRSSPEGLGGVR